MKKILSFLFAILFASSMMAEVGSLYYTFLPYKPSSGAVSDYTKTGTMTIDEMNWTVPGNWYGNGALRLGGKSLDGVDRFITAQDPMGSAISKIRIAHAGKTADAITLNSITVTTASDADFTQDVTEKTVNNFTVAKNTKDTIDIVPAAESWAINSYYKFAFNFTNSNGSNYAFVVESILFYAYAEGGGDEPGPQPSEDVWVVTGNNAALFGGSWDLTVAPAMELQNGMYVFEKTGVTLKKGNVEIKVDLNRSWDNANYPAQNYVLSIAEDGIYDVTVTFNPESKEVNASAEWKGEAEIDPTAEIRGINEEWGKGIDMTLSEDKATASATVTLPTGDQSFKIVLNGGEWRSNSGEFSRDAASAVVSRNDNDNMTLKADAAGDYIFKWTFAEDKLEITFPEKGDDPVTPPTPSGNSYVKVTAAPSDWAGEYLIVYEAENVAFNGGLEALDVASNTIAVEITEGAIPANETTKAAAFVIAAMDGGYSVQAANGKYIGVTSYGNGLKESETPYVHSILEVDESGNIRLGLENTDWEKAMLLNYNSAQNQYRFRYYKGGGQKAIQLYKLTEGGDTPIDPQPSEVTYSLKNNWDGSADWYWKEMEQKAPHLWQLNNVVFGGTGVNLISSEEGFDERWYPVGDEKLRGDAIEALDTVSFDWDPEADTLCVKIVGKYVPGGDTPIDPQPGKTGYALLVNGETYIDLQHGDEYDGYDQWFTDKAELKANDVVLIYSYETEAAWAIGILNPASSKYVERSDNGLFFSKEGTYTIYLKLKYEADEIYVAPLPDEGGDVPPVTPEGPIVLKFNGTGVADKDDSNEYGKDVAKIFDEASAPYVASVDSVKKVYAARPIDGDNSSLKFGTTTVAGYLAFTLATEMEFDSIIVNATQYGKNTAQIKINQQYEFTLNAGNKVPQDCKVIPTLEFESKHVFIEMLGTERLYLRSITLYPKQGDTPVDPQPSEVTYSLKNNWDGGADWYWKEMEQKAPHLWQLNNVVFGGTGVNLISSEEGFDERWYPVGDEKLRGDAIEALDTVSFDWDPEADTLCAKIVGKYIPGETPQTRYFLKNNWDGGEWRWKEMSAVPTVENYWQLQDVFGGTGVNLNTQASDEGQQWFPLDKIVGGDLIQAEDTVLFVYNAVDGTLAARLIGRPGGDTPGPQDPSAAIAISLLQWVPVPFTLSEDKSYATLSYRIPAGEYEFKMVINGAYRSNGYNFHRGYTGVAGLVDNVDANMTLQADVTGEYTIIWVFATDSIEFRFPEKPDEPTEMVDLRLVPGVWNTADAKFACLTLNEIPSSFSEDNIAEFITSATISNWFVGGDTVIGKIPADTKLLAFGRFNPAVEGDAPTIQDIMNTEMLWNHSDILMIDQSMIYTISAWEAEGGSDYSPGYWGDKPVEPSLADGVYIAGTMNNWTPSKDYVFKENEAQPGEYILQIDLSEGDEFKIVYISSGQEIWLPAGGEDTNIKVTAEYAGRVTIYFRPLGNPEWPAYYYYIVVEQEQGLNNINAAGKTVKMIQNGQILILKGDKTYNVLGTLVK